MQEIFDPLASTITLRFELNVREDNDSYRKIKDLLPEDLKKAGQAGRLGQRSRPAMSPQFPSRGSEKIALERNRAIDNLLGNELPRPSELEELREKVEQLEMENYHLVGSMNTLKSQMLSIRYEV